MCVAGLRTDPHAGSGAHMGDQGAEFSFCLTFLMSFLCLEHENTGIKHIWILLYGRESLSLDEFSDEPAKSVNLIIWVILVYRNICMCKVFSSAQNIIVADTQDTHKHYKIDRS